MSVASTNGTSLRLDGRQASKLAWAFGISLVIHVLCFSGYRLNAHYHLTEKWRLPAWLQLAKRTERPPVTQAQPAQPVVQREIPLMLVDVNPAQASAEPPKEAQFYSAQNSLAANPKADADSDKPKIEGKQTQIVKAETVTRSQAQPLQPAVAPRIAPQPPAPAAERAAETAPEVKPKAYQAPGDLALAKPAEVPKPGAEQTQRPRPRTIAEAKARQAAQPSPAGLIGEQMKQDGGVRRQALTPSFDARSTTFGAYDAAVVAAVQSRWYSLLDGGDFARDRTGKVVLEFRLNHDGRITEMKVVQNTVTELLCLLCQKAILDPAPYEKWPGEMRLEIGKDFRDVTFTFYYN